MTPYWTRAALKNAVDSYFLKSMKILPISKRGFAFDVYFGVLDKIRIVNEMSRDKGIDSGDFWHMMYSTRIIPNSDGTYPFAVGTPLSTGMFENVPEGAAFARTYWTGVGRTDIDKEDANFEYNGDNLQKINGEIPSDYAAWEDVSGWFKFIPFDETIYSDYLMAVKNVSQSVKDLMIACGDIVPFGDLAIFDITTTSNFVYFGVSSTSGYIRVIDWDGNSQIYGDGTTNPNWVIDEFETPNLFEVYRESTSPLNGKTIAFYACNVNGDREGEIDYLSTSGEMGYLSTIPKSLKGLWINNNSLDSIDLSTCLDLKSLMLLGTNSGSSININGLSELEFVKVEICLSSLADSLLNTLALGTKSNGSISNMNNRTMESDASVSTLESRGWTIVSE